MRFSDQFMGGLNTKSPQFQNEFNDIISHLEEYMDSDKRKMGFAQRLENTVSYYNDDNGFNVGQFDYEKWRKQSHKRFDCSTRSWVFYNTAENYNQYFEKKLKNY